MMETKLPRLRRDEALALHLRALYEENGYRLYRMGSFEEYDLYMQNKPFLMGEDIITFTGADGRLMALKPDVTLSIVKNTRPGEVRKVYYNENVFRRSHQTGEYREIKQMGLEYIGGSGEEEAQMLRLAMQSLAAMGTAALDVSHMGITQAVLGLFSDEGARAAAQAALRDKSGGAMLAAARRQGLDEAAQQALEALASLAGPFAETARQAGRLLKVLGLGQEALGALQQVAGAIAGEGGGQVQLRLDFSILNDVDYYNGLIFQGYCQGVSVPVLAGGRYDNLLRRFGKPQGAVGFAVYLDALGAVAPAPAQSGQPWLNVALPKGRLASKMYRLFAKIGFAAAAPEKESRKLVLEDEKAKVRYFLVKPTDVDIYVEHGVADVGVVGKDILMENVCDVLELVDLQFGQCRLAVAGPAGFEEDPAKPLRVATKYPTVARAYYAQKSRAVEIIKLHGSIELAPLVGLSDVIVDIVETGATLVENNLAVLEEIAPSSARLIANRASWRFKQERIAQLAQKLEEML